MKSSKENSIPQPLPQDVIPTKKNPKVTSRKKKKKRREVNKGKSKKKPKIPPTPLFPPNNKNPTKQPTRT
jgi:hypothetical protein